MLPAESLIFELSLIKCFFFPISDPLPCWAGSSLAGFFSLKLIGKNPPRKMDFQHFMGKLETVADFILGGSKITSDGDYSLEIKRHLLLGRKVITNLDSTLKIRDISLPTNVHLLKAMVFPVVMYGCESWTIKKGEH